MTGDQAEKRYYEIYSVVMGEEIESGRQYSRPTVQQDIRNKTWTRLLAEIEAEAQQSLSKDIDFLKQRCEQLTRDRDQAKEAYNTLMEGIMKNIEADARR